MCGCRFGEVRKGSLNNKMRMVDEKLLGVPQSYGLMIEIQLYCIRYLSHGSGN